MSENVVVFVTRTGHSKALAQEVGRRLDAQVFEIVDLVNRKGFFGFMKSGFQSTTKKATPIRDPFIHLEKIATVVIVHPVWASGLCPPVRTWLLAHKEELAGRRIAILLSNKGSDAAKVKESFEAEFRPLAAIANIIEKATPEEKSAKLDGFIAELNRKG